MKRRILLGVLLVVVGLGICQREVVSYGYMLVKGQFTMLYEARPVPDVLADAAVPDSVKTRIQLIQAIKQYAVDSLGLNQFKNFTTYYDQTGKPLTYMLIASDRYALKPLMHNYPIVGAFPYQGFFGLDNAKRADSLLRLQGYDTQIHLGAAYSTLGFFKDPILSSFLKYSEGRLAELIIHEMTHGTLFIKSSLEYNENLANFVGDYGADRYMAQKYGRTSSQYRDYVASNVYYEHYNDHVLRGTNRLDSLYKSFKPSTPVAVKDSLKWTLISQIVATTDTLPGRSANGSAAKRVPSKKDLPNNAYFVSFLTYNKQQNRFKTEFVNQFGSDFPRYLAHLKQTYPSL
ncbi:aminopeptidase [Fibrella aquatilis]|uniref:Aminopeptidase n=1 Tax=Fibrella aquatilis TaxID=2817059 RepID=A0A939GAB9_9BACT|nr:aminopeptidase [Fibrella aquatilis]MBO0934726.1 aminopeptidase [Fibrella aquatilis]